MLHHNRAVFAFALLGLLALTATCEGVPPGGFEPLQGEATGEMLEIDFNPKPPYLEKNVIVLTFDDGPDSTYTAKVLDILKDKQAKATFFINTINNANVDSQPAAQNLIKRIVAEGHELATHTVHHIDLAVQSDTKIEDEIVGVEKSVEKIFGPGGPKMTLLRAPFGRPYQSAAGSAAYNKVAAVVAKHAVHVGWAIDSNDWMYNGDSNRVYSNVTGLIKKPGEGAYGVILMHSINPQTVGALPRIIDYIRANGFVLKLTEDVVRARFGKSSAELLGVAAPGGTGGTSGSGGAGVSADAGSDAASGPGEADGPVATGGASQPGTDSGGSGGQGKGGAGGKGGSGGKGGTGGVGEDSTGGDDSGDEPHPTAKGGGCSYGGARQTAPAFALALVAAALLRARRRR